jgi:molecular chaperone DnaK (HSP70)
LAPEEITGMMLRYIKFLSDKFSKADIKDCVITVPVFFGYKQRQSIHQSAELAGLNVLGIINENLGAAIQYGLEKKFNKTENLIFYNMGSSHTQVSLVSYKTTEELNKVTNKTVDYNTITVILAFIFRYLLNRGTRT